MVIAYGFSNLFQSMAAQRTTQHRSMHPSLLLKLASQGVYLAGIGCQMFGFVLAFLARRELPLFLVQASVSGGIAVMALIGIVALKWKLPRPEIMLLGVLALGIFALVFAAKPGESRPIHTTGISALIALLIVIGMAGFFASRMRGVPGSVMLGSLAGVAFGAAAVDSRALASASSWRELLLSPLLYLLIAHSLTGQLLVGMAMQRGSTTAAVAAMDAASNAPAAIIGLALLGDQIWPGREWLAAFGFACTLGAVIGLARFAQPQSAHLPPVPTIRGTATVELPPAAIPLTPLMLGSPGYGPLRMPPPENPREAAQTMQLPLLVQLADHVRLRSTEGMPHSDTTAELPIGRIPTNVTARSARTASPERPPVAAASVDATPVADTPPVDATVAGIDLCQEAQVEAAAHPVPAQRGRLAPAPEPW